MIHNHIIKSQELTNIKPAAVLHYRLMQFVNVRHSAILIAAILSLISARSMAQSDKRSHSKIFTKVVLYEAPYEREGALKEAMDSSIVLWDMAALYYMHPDSVTGTMIPAKSIRTLKFKKDGDGRRGALWGALAGIALGASIGFASGDDPPCHLFGSCPTLFPMTAGAKATLGGLLLGLTGGGIGAIIGKSGVQIPIYGRQDNYEKSKSRIQKFIMY